VGQPCQEVRVRLQLDKKLGCRREQVNALGGLIYLKDSRTGTGTDYLVDTGAAVSVLPHRSTAPPSRPSLVGADGKPISAWGTAKKTLTFGLRNFFCSFILAAVARPILGIDFLAAHRLLVDPFSRLVLDAATLKPLGAAVAAAPSKFTATLCEIAPSIRTLLAAFPAIVGDRAAAPRPLHGVKHAIISALRACASVRALATLNIPKKLTIKALTT